MEGDKKEGGNSMKEESTGVAIWTIQGEIKRRKEKRKDESMYIRRGRHWGENMNEWE